LLALARGEPGSHAKRGVPEQHGFAASILRMKGDLKSCLTHCVSAHALSPYHLSLAKRACLIALSPVTCQMYWEHSREFDACVLYCRAKGQLCDPHFGSCNQSPCLMHMSVAQSRAGNRPHHVATTARRCAGRCLPEENMRQKCEGCEHRPLPRWPSPWHCRALWVCASAPGTCGRSRRVAQAALLVQAASDPANAQREQRGVWQGRGPWGATIHSAPGSDRIK
jgi:hypothetical protein